MGVFNKFRDLIGIEEYDEEDDFEEEEAYKPSMRERTPAAPRKPASRQRTSSPASATRRSRTTPI